MYVYICIGILRPNTLCRYRGLIQDMFGNEFYSGAINLVNKKTGEKKLRLSKYRVI